MRIGRCAAGRQVRDSTAPLPHTSCIAFHPCNLPHTSCTALDPPQGDINEAARNLSALPDLQELGAILCCLRVVTAATFVL